MVAKVNALWEVESTTEEELSHRDATQSALMPSILHRAFKGEM